MAFKKNFLFAVAAFVATVFLYLLTPIMNTGAWADSSESSVQTDTTRMSYTDSPGDIGAGKKVFARCGICHSLEPGVHKVGPSLAGLIGRKIGSLPDYRYSEAFKAEESLWTVEKLDDFLADIAGSIPGNKMASFYPAGVKDNKDRQDLIAYLLSLSNGQSKH